MLARLVRRLPPVARRDALIAALRRQREQASFGDRLREAKRSRALLADLGVREPIWQVNDKASGYRFALSHGVAIPRVYGEYARASDIAWDSLPGELVLKTITGTASGGVLPLAAVDGGYRDLLGRATPQTPAQLVARLEALHARGAASAAVIAEELLRAPAGSGLPVPPDYKLFCFDGVVGLVAVIGRRSRDSSGTVHRYLAADGRDLGDARLGQVISAALPAPRQLAELVAAGERLSAAVQAPFVRIDLYETDEGIVFGELTPEPGGDHVMRPDVDTALGELWEQAQARLERRVIEAGLRAPVFGPGEHRDLVR